MLDIKQKFFDDIDLIISYNFDEPAKSKTKCMAFGFKNNPDPIFLDGCPIPWVDKFKHLGHIKMEIHFMTQFKRKIFLLANFIPYANSSKIKIPLFILN